MCQVLQECKCVDFYVQGIGCFILVWIVEVGECFIDVLVQLLGVCYYFGGEWLVGVDVIVLGVFVGVVILFFDMLLCYVIEVCFCLFVYVVRMMQCYYFEYVWYMVVNVQYV